jgi:uncharacterized CHY-type Zn-finger protein
MEEERDKIYIQCQECNKYWPCLYLRHRFNTLECSKDKQMAVNKVHLKELQDRQVLLKGLSE